jgi:hypothetical protein
VVVTAPEEKAWAMEVEVEEGDSKAGSEVEARTIVTPRVIWKIRTGPAGLVVASMLTPVRAHAPGWANQRTCD